MWQAAVDAAMQHGASREHMERLIVSLVRQYPEALRRAWIGDPPARVRPILAKFMSRVSVACE